MTSPLFLHGRSLFTRIALVAAPFIISPLPSTSQGVLPSARPASDTSSTPGTRGVVDSSARHRDSVLLPPPSWGSVDTRLPSAWIQTRTAIALQPGRTLVDEFRSLPGFTLLNPESEGQYPDLFARGVDARSVGFLANGRSVQDPVSGITNPYHLQWMDADRAEIITGPRSFLYGLNCQGAAVNLVSKDFNAVKPYSRIVYAEGPENFSYSDGTFVQNISRRLNINVGFQHLSTDGAYSNSPHDQWNIRGRARYALTDGLALLLSGQYLSTQTGLNGGIDLAASGTVRAFQPLSAIVVNPDAYEKVTRSDLDLTLAGRWSDSTATFRVSLYSSHLLREYRDEENRPSPNGIDIRSDHDVRWTGLTAHQEIITGGFSILAGALAEGTGVRESPNLGHRNESHYALWLKGEADILPPLRIATYGRVERLYGMSGAGVGGDLEFTVTPDLALFAGISRSDRIPNLFERFWADSAVARSISADPGPEHHTHFEAGVDFHPSTAVRFRTAFFHRIIDNPIDLLETPSIGGFPGLEISQGGTSSRRTITGLDLALSLQLWHILLEGSGTYLGSGRGGPSPAGRAPKYQARGGVYVRGTFVDKHLDIKAGVRGTASSSCIGDRFNGETLLWGAASGPEIGAWSRLDFVVTAVIGDARIDFLWENLTNVQAFAARYNALPERGIWFRLAWEFLN